MVAAEDLNELRGSAVWNDRVCRWRVRARGWHMSVVGVCAGMWLGCAAVWLESGLSGASWLRLCSFRVLGLSVDSFWATQNNREPRDPPQSLMGERPHLGVGLGREDRVLLEFGSNAVDIEVVHLHTGNQSMTMTL